MMYGILSKPTAAAPGTSRRPVAACFGSGRAFGIGFNMGVVDALHDNGIPVDRGAMLGTSAGAWTAAALATGVKPDHVFETWDRHLRGRTLARASDSASDLLGDLRDVRVSGVAIKLSTGHRVRLRGDQLPLADIVAA
jgi:predicted acylesterase/phospholipase RssA